MKKLANALGSLAELVIGMVWAIVMCALVVGGVTLAMKIFDWLTLS